MAAARSATKRPAKAAARTQPRAFNLRLPSELVAEVDDVAAKERRSRVKMIEVMLEDWLRSHRGQRAA
jgi:metal-responsive CopG/Arc/MetJ family transcriptional regulator